MGSLPSISSGTGVGADDTSMSFPDYLRQSTPLSEADETSTGKQEKARPRNSVSNKRKSVSESPAPGKIGRKSGKGKRLVKAKKSNDGMEENEFLDGSLFISPGTFDADYTKGTSLSSSAASSKLHAASENNVNNIQTDISALTSISVPVVEESTNDAKAQTMEIGYMEAKVSDIKTGRDEQFPAIADSGSPDTSLVSTMSTEDIQQHLETLNDNLNLSSRRIAQKCIPIMSKLINDPNGWIFKDPVDPVELGIPDYFDVIKHPMDLALIKKRLENGVYKDLSSFECDTKLVFENCILYNGEDSDVGEMAKNLLNMLEKEFQSILKGE